jgi:integrase
VLRPLLARLGRVRLGALSPLHIAAALEELRREGMGSRSLELCWLTLHAALEEARGMGVVAQNPVARTPRPRHERREAKDWGLEDMRRFLAACLGDGRPLALMLALSLLSGLRVGELLGLQWGDVDLEKGTLAVRRSVTWAGSEWHEGPPKSKAGERVIGLPSLALGLLSRLPRESVHLFWRERPPARGPLSRLMGELCQRAGVPRRPAHYLRHAHATLLAAQGLDLKTLQRRLGHSQASVTLDVYAHALSEMDRRAAELLDRALGGEGHKVDTPAVE